ncbi:MAG TPA: hypothetical protein VMJ31_06750 [Methylocystis sp.]|nr:hypothetical protein [Methylocystis sp.]
MRIPFVERYARLRYRRGVVAPHLELTQGVEVGLVAKLAGHKSAVVTLSHYTHAMRGGDEAVKALDRAYAGSGP